MKGILIMKNYLITFDDGEQLIVEANSVNDCGDRVCEFLGCPSNTFEINTVLTDDEADFLGIDTI